MIQFMYFESVFGAFKHRDCSEYLHRGWDGSRWLRHCSQHGSLSHSSHSSNSLEQSTANRISMSTAIYLLDCKGDSEVLTGLTFCPNVRYTGPSILINQIMKFKILNYPAAESRLLLLRIL